MDCDSVPALCQRFGLSADAVADAHQKDIDVQDKHDVKYLKYWFDEDSGKVFCLCEAPNKGAAEAAHREAHGLMANEIIQVNEGAIGGLSVKT